MSERLAVLGERVDDLPFLLAQLEWMELQQRLDEHVLTHGTWVGISLGWVSMLQLLQLLSKTDQRLNHVAPGAARGLHTLRDGTGQAVQPLDVSDERLVTGLAALSDDPHWRPYVEALHPYGLLSGGSGPRSRGPCRRPCWRPMVQSWSSEGCGGVCDRNDRGYGEAVWGERTSTDILDAGGE